MVQEEIRQNTNDGSSSKHDDEGNCALTRKGKKVKGMSSHSKSDSSQGTKKKDMLKINFFCCHKLGHYAIKCQHKKVSKKPSRGAENEALTSQLETGFHPHHLHGDIDDG